MNIGIVGLGLIGGSLAKAIKQNTTHTVYGTDLVESVIYRAKVIEAIDEALTDENIGSCDVMIIALYPKDTIEYVTGNAEKIKKGALVMDCGGVKELVCASLKDVSHQHGFTFLGTHPMAGIEFSGFAYSQEQLFRNASMVLTPCGDEPIELLNLAKTLSVSLGFTNIQVTTPQNHDKMIALTSQLAHVVSSAYVKSPLALQHKGFSAGSFKDMTRVAKLNEDMWTELFLENKENLADEIDAIVQRLQDYGAAVRQGNAGDLRQLLKEGREIKEAIEAK